jgi:dihydroorotate dehydrogenase
MFKQDLTFSSPYMNAAGTLGFAPDFHAPIPWDAFGAFVTNPLSLRPRKPTAKPALLEYPGGFLMHTGLPNPGLSAVAKQYARRWADSRLPIIVHLMADRPDETMRMVQILEGLESVVAVELGFAPLLTDDIILLTIEMSLGELPLIVSLPVEQVLSLGPRAVQEGTAAISLAAPRGMVMLENGEQVTGRLNGAGLFPGALLTVRDAARTGIPVIGAGGVGSKENADAMLSVGALAVQVDASLWKGNFS